MEINVYQFLDLLKGDKNKKHELIILPNGMIIYSNKCHVEKMIDYLVIKRNKTRKSIENEIPENCLPISWLVDRYKFVAVWECGYMCSSNMTRLQKRTIKILMNENFFYNDGEKLYIQESTDYKDFIKNKEEISK